MDILHCMYIKDGQCYADSLSNKRVYLLSNVYKNADKHLPTKLYLDFRGLRIIAMSYINENNSISWHTNALESYPNSVKQLPQYDYD